MKLKAYNFAKSSKFPSVDNFEDLNISNKPQSLEIFENKDPKFDEDQELFYQKKEE